MAVNISRGNKQHFPSKSISAPTSLAVYQSIFFPEVRMEHIEVDHAKANATVVIYHADCFDGMCAAWVADRYFRKKGYSVVFHPARYGEDPPYEMCRGKWVYCIDFSYPREKLIRLKLEARELLVLDHHKTAQAELEGLSYANFDMERSGAGMAWDWFFSEEPRHWLVNCIEDRDLWRFKYEQTRFQMAWIATVPFTIGDYHMLSLANPFDIMERGKAIQRYINNYGKKAREHTVFKDIGGFTFPVMNMSYQNCSDHLSAFIEHSGGRWDRAASFFLTRDDKWQFSLRSVGEFDVSAIAKQYGGGGHKNAAGFTVEVLPWENHQREAY
jgi:oligoribonuclease NrnB/cAMP/cGMP phosphodiesterase (DHH superfamily)